MLGMILLTGFTPLGVGALILIVWKVVETIFHIESEPESKVFRGILRIYKVTWQEFLSGEQLFFTPLKTWFILEIVKNAVSPNLQIFLVGYWVSRPAQAALAWWFLPPINWVINQLKPMQLLLEKYGHIRKGPRGILWWITLPIYLLDRLQFGNFMREILLKGLMGVKTPEEIWARKNIGRTFLRMLGNVFFTWLGIWMINQLLLLVNK